MNAPHIDVTRVIASGVDLTPPEAEAILEIAYLSTVIDGRLSDEELASFAHLAARLRKKPIEGAELDKLLDGFAAQVEHKDVDERLAQLAAALGRDAARRTAYKVAFAMALCDLASSDDEADFDDALLEVLKIPVGEADDLESEVYAALDDAG
jgi:hypothetical protein